MATRIKTPLKKSVKPGPAEPNAKKKALPKLTDAEQVAAYMLELKHPLKAEMEAVRSIIKNANKKISERIKWKAPSYHYQEDIVTFNGWATENVHLVFHHPGIVKIESPILEGNYPTRRMVYFTGMDDVKKKKKELKNVLNQLMDLIDTNNVKK